MTNDYCVGPWNWPSCVALGDCQDPFSLRKYPIDKAHLKDNKTVFPTSLQDSFCYKAEDLNMWVFIDSLFFSTLTELCVNMFTHWATWEAQNLIQVLIGTIYYETEAISFLNNECFESIHL